MTTIADTLAMLPPDLAALLQQGRDELNAKQRAEDLQKQREYHLETDAATSLWESLQHAVCMVLPPAVHAFVNTAGDWMTREDGAPYDWSSKCDQFTVEISVPGCCDIETFFVRPGANASWVQVSWSGQLEVFWLVRPHGTSGPDDEPPFYTVFKSLNGQPQYAESLPVALAIAADEHERRNRLLIECEQKNAEHAERMRRNELSRIAKEVVRETPEGRLFDALRDVIWDTVNAREDA